MTETKVTAAAVASALVPLVLLVSQLAGWEVTEETASTWLLAVATVAIPAVTFIAGWLRKSTTSRVSDGFVDAPTVVGGEKVYGSGEAGMAVSELLLLVIAVCVLIALVVGWGLVT